MALRYIGKEKFVVLNLVILIECAGEKVVNKKFCSEETELKDIDIFLRIRSKKPVKFFSSLLLFFLFLFLLICLTNRTENLFLSLVTRSIKKTDGSLRKCNTSTSSFGSILFGVPMAYTTFPGKVALMVSKLSN